LDFFIYYVINLLLVLGRLRVRFFFELGNILGALGLPPEIFGQIPSLWVIFVLNQGVFTLESEAVFDFWWILFNDKGLGD